MEKLDREVPFVSIIIPCRNEERFIGKCIDSIIIQDYPKEKLEVLVVDGMSNDNTRDIVLSYSKKYSFIKLLDNPAKITPTALNIGIKNANGEVIIRMDAHSIYREDYVSKCIKWLQEYNVENVGGICITLPGDETLIAKSIAFVLSHPFGVGNSYFRLGIKESKYVDTVPFGCYRRDVFDKIGSFNEDLTRNQDIEFNLRLRRAGGKILLVPEIISYYYARPDLKSLFKQNFWNGFWVVYSARFAKLPFSIRHLVPAVFVLSLFSSFLISLWIKPVSYLFLFVLSSYLIANLFFSFKLSLENGFKYFIPLILSFFTLHFSYGIGSIWGIIKLTISRFSKKRG